jgi:hypothetical protein
MGLDPHEALRRYDGATLLGFLGDLVVTGPMGTSLGDVGIGLLGLGCGVPRFDPVTMSRPVPDVPA